MDQPENPTSAEAGRSVLGPVMWQEVLRLVIAPKLAALVAEHGEEIENRQDLHRRFCDEHGVKPSYSTFSGWCEDLGITFRKRIEVRIPGWKEMPRPAGFIGPMPAMAPTQPMQVQIQPVEMEPEPDAPVAWDQPQTQINMAGDGLNIPEVLPGGMRPPAFLNQSDFAN